MKKIILIVLTCLFFLPAIAQEFLTYREVNDYEIGDEFHYLYSNPDQYDQKTITRINILDKYYSLEQDTLFYFRHYVRIESDDLDQNGNLTYFYSEGNSTVFYTDLDSSIAPEYDNYSIENSTAMCDSLVNSFSKYISGGANYHNEFGKGLGHIVDSYNSYHGSYSRNLKYYKKGEFDCGTPLSWSDVLTIGEVFDFEIGDEFQTKSLTNIFPVITDRFNIIDKFYSTELDTVFYVRFHDSYNVDTDTITLDTVLTFRTKTDTGFYTNLDSYIASYDHRILRFQSYPYCGLGINGRDFGNYKIEYGKGLGQVSSDSTKLFYFKKGSLECGTADTTTLGINDFYSDNEVFSVFPNPAKSFITVVNKSQQSFYCKIFNLHGQQIISTELNPGPSQIDINYLESGLFFVQISDGTRISVLKIIVE